MTYKCEKCGLQFEGKEALCEDWSIPAKSFICPGCATPLAKPKAEFKLSKHMLVNFGLLCLISVVIQLAADKLFESKWPGSFVNVIVIIFFYYKHIWSQNALPLVCKPYEERV